MADHRMLKRANAPGFIRNFAGLLTAAIFLMIAVLVPIGAYAQSATVSASPSSFTSVGQQITFTYTIIPGTYSMTSISGASQIKGVPIT